MRISDWSSDVCSSDLDEGHGVRRVAFTWPALALAEHQDGGERSDSCVHVDGGAAGEVEGAALAQPAAVDPLEHGHEHEDQPDRHEDRPGTELHPIGDGT